MTIPSLLITVLRVLLGSILLLAGISKLSGFSTFIVSVDNYQILPIGLVKPISYLIVSTELTVGAALCIGYFSRGASIISALLFMIFGIAVANVLWRELPVNDCGCGNFLFSFLDLIGFQISTAPNWKIVLADIFFAIGSCRIAYSDQQGYGLDALIRSMQRPQD